MTEQTKKYLAVGMSIVCLIILGLVLYRTVFSSTASANDKGNALLCAKCGGMEVSADEYRQILADSPVGPVGMPLFDKLTCPRCGQNTCQAAVKCSECGTVFVPGQAGAAAYSGRCPQCRAGATQ